MIQQEYFDLLGVSRSASDKEIAQAYRKLARECHPDANPELAGAEERFKRLNEAHEVLLSLSYDERAADMYEVLISQNAWNRRDAARAIVPQSIAARKKGLLIPVIIAFFLVVSILFTVARSQSRRYISVDRMMPGILSGREFGSTIALDAIPDNAEWVINCRERMVELNPGSGFAAVSLAESYRELAREAKAVGDMDKAQIYEDKASALLAPPIKLSLH